MPTFRIKEAAGLLGVSDDTLRRWADGGRVETITDASGRRAVDGVALARLAQELAETADYAEGKTVVARSARNRFQGLVTRVGVRLVLPTGLALSTVALVLFARLPVDGSYWVDLFPAFMISGLGLALAFVPMSIGALTGVREADAGIASGLINTTQQIGGAVGVALATTVATTFTAHYVDGHAGSNAFSGPALTHGFQIAFYVLAALAAVGAVLSAVMIESTPAEPDVVPVDEAVVELEAAA